MVALHFSLGQQAGWECDACRKAGLEKKRRCGWLGVEDDGRGPVVWARGGVATTRCPKSVVTGESEAMVEEYFAWRRLGSAARGSLSARQVEAFVILEGALAEERRYERRTRNAV